MPVIQQEEGVYYPVALHDEEEKPLYHEDHHHENHQPETARPEAEHHSEVNSLPPMIDLKPVADRLVLHLAVLTVLTTCSLAYFWPLFSLSTNLWAAFWAYLFLGIGFMGASSRSHGLLTVYMMIRVTQMVLFFILWLVWMFSPTYGSLCTNWLVSTGAVGMSNTLTWWLVFLFNFTYMYTYFSSVLGAYVLRAAIIHNTLVSFLQEEPFTGVDVHEVHNNPHYSYHHVVVEEKPLHH
mmetsp:Transcript_38117/g.95912  ORF Transcript_38117/g.95912 Transcript_38117/m.95912 type:complete len:238 (+) Transcript_38117:112-825(+)|eukprot:CAMPEP_0177648786 /NCGR_PEP_ID=MMETSP0447-20121125/11016_1 /TAXON_ID=0 /ORGANISM="Stygamoeba regulata, Strain BSH-02190019" /LENGTH=237 /DNA_ID=CAMNT_0019151455 /DNA_START=116 /DNA_END=829 /DNA_ORIENTATION=+